MIRKIKKIFIFWLIFIVSNGMLINSTPMSITSEARNSAISVQITESGNVSKGLKDNSKGNLALLNVILSKYRTFIIFLTGIGAFSMILFFIFNFVTLAGSRGNPQVRQKAIHGLIVTGIATAGLGSVTLITTLFYNMIKDKDIS